ncbi:hypothetical protein [Microbacterium sp. PM5]|uniref:hypothetical protein n=1 Tax=Microbacterium sp. PM5 TaxID=2014534 RepID=UPI000DD0FAE4|nr:hypothetical protein [Microbacterium sp. PM5]AXA95424.1 hypothetical protein CEP17_02770 [Microbacterium sp. PM5]
MNVHVPLVRDEHGAILGIDYRRSDLSPITAPGTLAVESVMPGDTIRVGRAEEVVLSKAGHVGSMGVRCRTGAGVVVEHEYVSGTYLEVTAVGAFDPEEPTP